MKKQQIPAAAAGPIPQHTALYKLLMRIATQIVTDRRQSGRSPAATHPARLKPK